MGEFGSIVKSKIFAPISLAFVATASKVAVLPEPEPMIKQSPAQIGGVVVSPTK
jgi:hypothetical protein